MNALLPDVTPPPSPRKGDLIFRGDLPDYWNNARLNLMEGTPEKDEFCYTEGYRLGAQNLIGSVVDTKCNQDLLVYPILFLYRHHMELMLKKLLRRAACLIDPKLSRTEEGNLKDHKLDPLWKAVRRSFFLISERAGWDTGEDACDIDGIEDYIRQLNELDPDGQRSRYASLKDGTPSLDFRRINLRHFGEMMERLTNGLAAIEFVMIRLEKGNKNGRGSYNDRASTVQTSSKP